MKSLNTIDLEEIPQGFLLYGVHYVQKKLFKVDFGNSCIYN